VPYNCWLFPAISADVGGFSGVVLQALAHSNHPDTMPIYAYKCDACGFAKDVLQKMSDDPLVDCPSCGKPAFTKQLTAAGFQLKGSGWYVTDFRGGNTATPAATGDDKSAGKSDAAVPSAPAASDSPAPAAAPASVAAPAAAPTAASSSPTPAKS
jgi:putative FmdB family regulatory protein